MAGTTRSAETARALIRKTRRATRRRFPTEDKIRIVMEGVRGEVSVAELQVLHSEINLLFGKALAAIARIPACSENT